MIETKKIVLSLVFIFAGITPVFAGPIDGSSEVSQLASEVGRLRYSVQKIMGAFASIQTKIDQIRLQQEMVYNVNRDFAQAGEAERNILADIERQKVALKAANAQESDASTPEEVRVAKEAALLAEMNIAAQSKNLDHAVSEKLRYKQLFDRADKELAALKSAVEELQKDLAEAEKLGVKVQDVGAIPPAPDEIHPAASAAQ